MAAEIELPEPPVGRTPGGRLQGGVHELALRVRPTELGAVLKRLARIRRGYVRAADGSWFWVDPASQLGHALTTTQAYEPEMEALLRAVLRPGDSFVDVGANEGVFTVLAAQICGDGTVVAVEPQSRLLHVLHRNLEINGCTRVTVRALGLDAKPGWLRMYLRPSTNPGASGLNRRRLDVLSELVPVSTLDAVVETARLGSVRLVKVDCEGAEDRVIAGSGGLLSAQRVTFLALEFHPTVGPDGLARSRALHESLRSYGYVHSVVLGRHVYHVPGAEGALEAAGDVAVGAEFSL